MRIPGMIKCNRISLTQGCRIQASQYACIEEVAMRKLVPFTGVVALALLVGVHFAAAAEMKTMAKLTGAAETAGGDPKGSGTAQVTVNSDKTEVCNDLTGTDVPDASAAHIHEGAGGKDGVVKVPFDPPKAGAAKGCKTADATLVKEIIQNPANYYVNVHNAAFPKGAVRWQVSK